MLQKSVLLRFSDAGNAERRGYPGKCNVTPFLKGEFLFMPRFSGKEVRSGVLEKIPGKREREKLSLFVSGCQSGSSGPVCPSRRRFSLTISFSFLFLCSLILLTYLGGAADPCVTRPDRDHNATFFGPNATFFGPNATFFGTNATFFGPNATFFGTKATDNFLRVAF